MTDSWQARRAEPVKSENATLSNSWLAGRPAETATVINQSVSENRTISSNRIGESILFNTGNYSNTVAGQPDAKHTQRCIILSDMFEYCGFENPSHRSEQQYMQYMQIESQQLPQRAYAYADEPIRHMAIHMCDIIVIVCSQVVSVNSSRCYLRNCAFAYVTNQ